MAIKKEGQQNFPPHLLFLLLDPGSGSETGKSQDPDKYPGSTTLAYIYDAPTWCARLRWGKCARMNEWAPLPLLPPAVGGCAAQTANLAHPSVPPPPFYSRPSLPAALKFQGTKEWDLRFKQLRKENYKSVLRIRIRCLFYS